MPSWRDNKDIPEFNMNEVRDIVFTWLQLISSPDMQYPIISEEVAEKIIFAADKSNYLGRRFVGELHRTEQCPKHKGKWSGIPIYANQCDFGCDLTGWLPRAKVIPMPNGR